VRGPPRPFSLKNLCSLLSEEELINPLIIILAVAVILPPHMVVPKIHLLGE
jgi:hypothetical protein